MGEIYRITGREGSVVIVKRYDKMERLINEVNACGLKVLETGEMSLIRNRRQKFVTET